MAPASISIALIFSRLVCLQPFSGATTIPKKVPATTSTPTTRILAIGTINPGVDPAKVLEILPNEVRETVNLYLDGKIDPLLPLNNGQ